MDVFLIGNGFDLHYCLPTTYTCFLRTVESISERLAKGERITSVAQVFGDSDLYNSDRALKRCYDTYGADYNAELDPDQIGELFGRAEQNLWFTYLLRSFDAGKGWIDFEREIGQVIEILSSALETQFTENKTVYIYTDIEDKRTIHILSLFPFFFDDGPVDGLDGDREAYFYAINPKYLTEIPFGSGVRHINRTEVAKTLYKSLRELADMLAAYLRLFVDRPVENMAARKIIHPDRLLSSWRWENSAVVSFNYTHTADWLYDLSRDVHFIHGELDDESISRIVLGINADEADEIGSANTTFIQFKKYYQRVFYQTDLSYIAFVNAIDRKADPFWPIRLYVIGHSLDKTDQEVILDLFTRAVEITIFYHSDSAISDYIRNLVSIFGKKQFDLLRTTKNLQFLSLDNLNSPRLLAPGLPLEFLDLRK